MSNRKQAGIFWRWRIIENIFTCSRFGLERSAAELLTHGLFWRVSDFSRNVLGKLNNSVQTLLMLRHAFVFYNNLSRNPVQVGQWSFSRQGVLLRLFPRPHHPLTRPVLSSSRTSISLMLFLTWNRSDIKHSGGAIMLCCQRKKPLSFKDSWG